MCNEVKYMYEVILVCPPLLYQKQSLRLTLLHPRSPRLQVRWSHDRRHHTLASPYSLRLASVDTNSTCVIWDVGQAAVVSEFVVGNKPLIDMQWLNTNVSGWFELFLIGSPIIMFASTRHY